jgi:hypothetical protein
MQSFFSFLRSPTYNEVVEKFSLKNFVYLICIYFIAIIPLGSILIFLFKGLGFNHKAMGLGIKEKVFYAILLSPVIEELLFRLILVFNKKSLIVLITTTVILLTVFIIKGNVLKVALYSVLTIAFVLCIIQFTKCRLYFIMYFRMFFFFIAGLFAILHIFNFLDISLANFMFLPLLVIPQFFLGIILGYIRITYGFVFAVFFHMLVNLTVIL